MEYCPGEFMPLFTAIQLSERSPAFRFIIYIAQSMNGLIDSAQFRDCLREFGGSISDLQRSHHRHCLHDTEL